MPANYVFPFADQQGKIAFQGWLGAFSHLAAKTCYPNHTAVPHDSFESAFSAVARGDCDLAMIPIQNSTGGRVADIHQLLPRTNLFIVAEHFQPIHHCLLMPKGADPKNLRYVYSHPQALSQCKTTLAEKNLTPIEYYDTAAAAAMLVEKNDPTLGAIASTLCADIYGLQIVSNNMEDSKTNVTRFIVLAKDEIIPPATAEPVVSAMIFSARSIPAALYKCLGGFATNKINLVKIESYIPILGDDAPSAEFYIEFMGSPHSNAVKNALEELSHFTTTMRSLGSFVKNSVAGK